MMQLFKSVLFVLVVFDLSAQSTDTLVHTKSFYYDVDNFSLTQESMSVLAEFVAEIKLKPIDVTEIVGYVETEGSGVYNHIRSKKRMSKIKETIDTAMIIHQYTPENSNFAPAFLYTYEDGINWKRVDISYVYKEIPVNPVLVKKKKADEIVEVEAPIENQSKDSLLSVLPQKSDTSVYNPSKEVVVQNETINNSVVNPIKDTVAVVDPIKPIVPSVTDPLTPLDNNISNQNNPIDSTETIVQHPKTPEELAYEKYTAEQELMRIQGKTQQQLDNIIIPEKPALPKRVYTPPVTMDMSQKLKEIDVSKLDKSVALVVMNIQFEEDEPIMTPDAHTEMGDLFRFLDTNKMVHAFIRGHVCCGDEYKLSKKRAKHVYKQLVKFGIEEERLRYQGFSNSLLLVSPERTDNDRARNRRVDVIFSIPTETGVKLIDAPVKKVDDDE